MPSRVLPNVGITAFYDLGEDGWGTTVSEDFLKLSVLVQPVVQSFVASLPGSPTDGDVHVVTGSPYNGAILVRDDAAWTQIDPLAGWTVFDLGSGAHYWFDGTDWIALVPVVPTTLDGLSDVAITSPTTGQVLQFDGTNFVNATPSSGGGISISSDSGTSISLTNTHLSGDRIVRCTGATAITFTIGSGLTGTEPVVLVQSGAGQITLAASSTTLRAPNNRLKSRAQYSQIVITPLGSDTYLIGGDITT